MIWVNVSHYTSFIEMSLWNGLSMIHAYLSLVIWFDWSSIFIIISKAFTHLMESSKRWALCYCLRNRRMICIYIFCNSWLTVLFWTCHIVCIRLSIWMCFSIKIVIIIIILDVVHHILLTLRLNQWPKLIFE